MFKSLQFYIQESVKICPSANMMFNRHQYYEIHNIPGYEPKWAHSPKEAWKHAHEFLKAKSMENFSSVV